MHGVARSCPARHACKLLARSSPRSADNWSNTVARPGRWSAVCEGRCSPRLCASADAPRIYSTDSNTIMITIFFFLMHLIILVFMVALQAVGAPADQSR